jgi:hypothetical protein
VRLLKTFPLCNWCASAVQDGNMLLDGDLRDLSSPTDAARLGPPALMPILPR